MVHAGGVYGGGVHGGGVMLTLATPHSRRCWQLFLRLSPYSRSSPFSGTALSQALSTPAGRAFPFRALRPAWAFPFRPKPIETPQVRQSFAPRILRRRPGGRGFERSIVQHCNASRPSAGPRAGRIARPKTDEDPLRAVQVLPRFHTTVQTYGFGKVHKSEIRQSETRNSGVEIRWPQRPLRPH